MSAKYLVINGAGGRMGRELMRLAQEDKKVFAVTGVDPGLDLPEENVVSDIDLLSSLKTSVVVDFSTPPGMLRALRFAKTKRLPFVSGTTGLSAAQKKALQISSRQIPVLWAPNMSLGIAVFRKMIAKVSGLHGFDFQIEESHHKNKKDKPSGTALLLQKDLEQAIKRRAPKPLSIRGGGVPGEHRLLAMGPEEVLLVQHTALNRSVFAQGALTAAHWLAKRRPGLYVLEDVLE